MKKNALILIDLQIDFCPGGAMEVPNGDLVMPIANQLMEKFDVVIATQDWHPANHGSFAANHPWRHIGQTLNFYGLDQELFPIHCVQDTFGALLHNGLNKEDISLIIKKGISVELDDYSCFFDADRRRSTDLEATLKAQDIEILFFMGLGTERCIKNSVLDSLDLDFETFIIEDVCNAWDKREGDGKKAIKEMIKAGAKTVTSNRLLNQKMNS